MIDQFDILVTENNDDVTVNVTNNLEEVVDIFVAEAGEEIELNITNNIVELNIIRVDVNLSLTTNNNSGPATYDNITGVLNIPNYAPNLSGYVPYTGATANVNLGTHTLLAKDLVINHSSGSGVAASITKNGSGEALTVIKGSGSGNAMSVTGGLTSLVNLSLSTVANATGDFLTHSGSTINKRTPAQVLSDIGGQAALTNPITGTGANGQVAFWNGTNTQTGDNGLFWDNVNKRLGVGTGAPRYFIDVIGSLAAPRIVSFENTTHASQIRLRSSTVEGNITMDGTGGVISGGGLLFNSSTNIFHFMSGGTSRMVFRNNNLLIGTTADAGFRLDVNGTARVQGALTVSTGGAQITGALQVLTGGEVITGNSRIITGQTGLTLGGNSDVQTLTENTNKRARINVPQYGTSSSTPIGIIQANANVSSNSIHIGGIQSGYSLAADEISFFIGATYNATTANQIARFFSTGNLVLQNGGTFTDAGFRLDVQGTARVSSSITAGSFIISGGTSSQFLKADGSVDSTSYQPLLTNPITGTGTTNFLPKFTGASTLGNSLIFDNGTGVGIGTTDISPDFLRLERNQNANTSLRVRNSDAGSSAFAMLSLNASGNAWGIRMGSSAANSNALDFLIDAYGTPTSVMRLTPSGNVGIGTTSPSERLHVVGNGLFSGSVTATAFFASSDIRLKDIIAHDGDMITYKWKDGRDDKIHYGYSAQNLQKINPNLVNKNDDGFLSVNYTETLVFKVRELEKEVQLLKAQIN
jgi:hypothetical protein